MGPKAQNAFDSWGLFNSETQSIFVVPFALIEGRPSIVNICRWRGSIASNSRTQSIAVFALKDRGTSDYLQESGSKNRDSRGQESSDRDKAINLQESGSNNRDSRGQESSRIVVRKMIAVKKWGLESR